MLYNLYFHIRCRYAEIMKVSFTMKLNSRHHSTYLTSCMKSFNRKVTHCLFRHLTSSQHFLRYKSTFLFFCNSFCTYCNNMIPVKHYNPPQKLKRWYENYETKSWFIYNSFTHVYERYILLIYLCAYVVVDYIVLLCKH